MKLAFVDFLRSEYFQDENPNILVFDVPLAVLRRKALHLIQTERLRVKLDGSFRVVRKSHPPQNRYKALFRAHEKAGTIRECQESQCGHPRIHPMASDDFSLRR